MSVYLTSAVNLCLTVLWSEIRCSTVEKKHTIFYLQIPDTQLISVTHGNGHFPKVVFVVW